LRFLASFAAALCLLALCAPLRAQDAPAAVAQGAAPQAGVPQTAAPASAKLAKVSVTGSTRFTSDQIVAEIGLKQGQNVTRGDLQSAADKLTQLGTFAKIAYRFSSAPDGVTVEYQVADAPGLPISFDNFPWVGEDDLRNAIKAVVPLYDGTGPANGRVLDQMADAVRQYLLTKGIVVQVSHTPMSDPLTGQMTVAFVSAGAEEDVKSIDFSDGLANTNAAIQQRLADLIGKPFSLTALKLFEAEQVEPIYMNRGLLRITFKPPVVQAPSPTAATTPTVVVHVEIDAGAQYTWGGVSWTGNAALSASELNALVSFKPGEQTDGTKIQALWLSIADAYGHKGYLDATATPTPQFDDQAHRVNYNVAIVEGPQYKMDDLVLSGLSVAGERAVRSAWTIQQGQVFDETFYNAFVDSGAKNSFSGIGIPYEYQRIDHFLEKDPASAKVNVLLDFK
jgi:outer membrane protein assembly factor BamA